MGSGDKALDASEVYDRQIRLWGLEAQKRMQGSRVLFIGLRALQAEICKNLVLAGINVAILDDKVVSPVDLVAQFYLRPSDVGKNRAEACLPGVQEMNPLAKVECHTGSPQQLADSFFEQFDVICASDMPPSQAVRLGRVARDKGRLFMYADTFGPDGWALMDFGAIETQNPFDKGPDLKFDYPPVEEVFKAPWSALKDRWGVPRVFVAARLLQLFEEAHGHRPSPLREGFENDVDAFLTLSKRAMAENGLPEDMLSETELREVARCAVAELSPVCAVLGGILGQEVLKAISRKGELACNCFVFDGNTNEGRVLQVATKR